ncbi:adenosylcobinamide-GDP ribazoletransferase [Desulfospira joergensenii]|uniref:adenosylcobinamide-GDP ribazoletransferase n=1 Tax=Desulfospira joergensenii TaxID=53329 RepID=UPI0003B579AA|nr:adenosylcobinamide-GDP ribazoletransferase [Desulfospira joergensenii]
MKSNFLSGLRSALLFITILPAGKDVAWSPMAMIRFFPVVGMILGGLLILADLLVSRLWAPPVAALLDVVFLLAVTGAFHMDGLGDAADGIFSHRPRERALEIMKDSRIGMMGLVAVGAVLALKLAGIYSLKTTLAPFQIIVLLLIVPAYSRASMIFGIRFLNYGRKGTGTGLDLFERAIGLKDFFYCLIPLLFSLFLGVRGLVLNLFFIIGLVLILGFYKKKMNCITGDMLGAMTEVMEALLFLGAGAAFN